MEEFDEDQMMKEFQKEMDKNKKKLDKDGGDSHQLNKEEMAKLQEATHDKAMLADADGEIHRVSEIDFIIKDILKHQDKAFKLKRRNEDTKESVECAEGEVNDLLREKDFHPADTAALAYLNDEVMKSQRGVIFYLAKKIGVNLLTGKSIMNISLPIKIFEPRSMLEKVACDFRFAPYYFAKALQVQDPVERMKIIATYYIASLQIEPQMKKPFNPILGETFQATIGDYEIAVEQISHHPPITALQMWSETIENSPIVDGYWAFEASTGLTAITGSKEGRVRIYFPDTKQMIVATAFPGCDMRGVMKGTRTYDFVGQLKISDEGNQLYTDVIFNPDKKGWFKRMFSSAQKTHHDYFEGVITDSKEFDYKSERGNDLDKMQKKGKLKVHARMEGNWTTSMNVDDVLVWEYVKYKPLKV